jgi:hypothetical protein
VTKTWLTPDYRNFNKKPFQYLLFHDATGDEDNMVIFHRHVYGWDIDIWNFTQAGISPEKSQCFLIIKIIIVPSLCRQRNYSNPSFGTV